MAPTLSKYQRVGIALTLLSLIDEKKERKKRKWMKRELKERLLLNNSKIELDFDDVRNILKMEKDLFYQLLEMVRPLIEKRDTNMREAVSAEERLLITLRFIATGTDYRDLRYSSVISHQLISKIIPETCRAIFKVLKDTIKLPSTEDEWKKSAQLFESQWQFNNCVGCIGGKHILIQKPPKSGSLFYNYKGTCSVVLFAVVNANYEFMYVHTGSNGSISNGDVIKNTKFYEKLTENELRLPESYLLPGTDVNVPYVFLGDSAFELDTHIMTPYSESECNITEEETIFNYRLQRASQVAENVFGNLTSHFGVLKHPINLKLENVDAVVLACCALHNFLKTNSETYMPSTCVDREDIETFSFRNGTWREEKDQLIPLQRNMQNTSNEGKEIRNILTEYFNGVGRVPFQDRMANIFVTNYNLLETG